jgi:dTDP-glucose 4,6-dehydratase
MTILVTGGAGFIGSNFVLDWLARHDEPVLNLDALTYAGNLRNLAALQGDARHRFVKGDITDRACSTGCWPNTGRAWWCTSPPKAMSTAASWGRAPSSRPTSKAPSRCWKPAARTGGAWTASAKQAFRFHHVSTDEVYGSLASDAPAFTETHPYEPNSPYSASKAASDHLVRAWFHTYGLPVLTTNCSNNYGPWHFPEKLIPLMIVNALAGKPLPIYGDGLQVRDWLYVADHCSAIRAVIDGGRPGEVYNVGGWNEKTNREIVHTVCALLDELRPDPAGPYTRLITHVKDRPGHDRRYAIDARKIERELGWRPAETFDTGIRKTVRWYLDHADWVADVQSGGYRDWVDANYNDR